MNISNNFALNLNNYLQTLPDAAVLAQNGSTEIGEAGKIARTKEELFQNVTGVEPVAFLTALTAANISLCNAKLILDCIMDNPSEYSNGKKISGTPYTALCNNGSFTIYEPKENDDPSCPNERLVDYNVGDDCYTPRKDVLQRGDYIRVYDDLWKDDRCFLLEAYYNPQTGKMAGIQICEFIGDGNWWEGRNPDNPLAWDIAPILTKKEKDAIIEAAHFEDLDVDPEDVWEYCPSGSLGLDMPSGVDSNANWDALFSYLNQDIGGGGGGD